jgi:hypothetical protein
MDFFECEISSLKFYTRGKRGKSPREQGFRRDVTGSERQGNQFAPPVANCCGGRGNILWRACEFLAAAAKRHKTFGFWRCFILKKYRPYRMQRYKKKRRNARGNVAFFVSLQGKRKWKRLYEENIVCMSREYLRTEQKTGQLWGCRKCSNCNTQK